MRFAEEKDIPFLVSELDNAFGTGYMTEEAIRAHIKKEDSFFFIEDAENRPAAALLFLQEPMEKAMEEMEISEEKLREISGGKPILHSKFLFVREDLQRKGVGERLLRDAFTFLDKEGKYGAVYGIFAIYNDSVPVQRACERNGYVFHKFLPHPWYKDKDYNCWLCKGRCRCDGLVYYRKIR